ncbi:hypothetical protein PUN28_003294 [Cardiocondyla obscurior]|uniref:Uncharacterized protein n=1 Tax=Cardiocondyla obscurior TaxID=286306 RepID=A0AAW2GNJ6_9HYME
MIFPITCGITRSLQFAFRQTIQFDSLALNKNHFLGIILLPKMTKMKYLRYILLNKTMRSNETKPESSNLICFHISAKATIMFLPTFYFFFRKRFADLPRGSLETN